MRKLLKLAVVAFGIRTLLRWRKRRQEREAISPAPAPADDPADELRRKLADSRVDDPGEVDEPSASSVSDRRADVHEQGRAALDDMKSSDES